MKWIICVLTFILYCGAYFELALFPKNALCRSTLSSPLSLDSKHKSSTHHSSLADHADDGEDTFLYYLSRFNREHPLDVHGNYQGVSEQFIEKLKREGSFEFLKNNTKTLPLELASILGKLLINEQLKWVKEKDIHLFLVEEDSPIWGMFSNDIIAMSVLSKGSDGLPKRCILMDNEWLGRRIKEEGIGSPEFWKALIHEWGHQRQAYKFSHSEFEKMAQKVKFPHWLYYALLEGNAENTLLQIYPVISKELKWGSNHKKKTVQYIAELGFFREVIGIVGENPIQQFIEKADIDTLVTSLKEQQWWEVILAVGRTLSLDPNRLHSRPIRDQWDEMRLLYLTALMHQGDNKLHVEKVVERLAFLLEKTRKAYRLEDPYLKDYELDKDVGIYMKAYLKHSYIEQWILGWRRNDNSILSSL